MSNIAPRPRRRKGGGLSGLSLTGTPTAHGVDGTTSGDDTVPAAPSAAAGPTGGPAAVEAPVELLLDNPHNPRDEAGDLSDLASIIDHQDQAASAITVAAYLRLYPDDAHLTTGKRWVVHRGKRRLAAAHEYGRPTLLIVVDDRDAVDRQTLLGGSIRENIARRGFNPMEEARAVEHLVGECGDRQDIAAQKLSKSVAWINNQVSLVRKLHPQLQELVADGTLPKTTAREIARTDDHGQQMAIWQQMVEEKAAEEAAVTKHRELTEKRKEGEAAGSVAAKVRLARPPATSATVGKALRRLNAEPATLAEALYEYLGEDGVRSLVEQWTLTGLSAK